MVWGQLPIAPYNEPDSGLFTVWGDNHVDHTVYVKNLTSMWAWLLSVAILKEGRSMGVIVTPQEGHRP